MADEHEAVGGHRDSGAQLSRSSRCRRRAQLTRPAPPRAGQCEARTRRPTEAAGEGARSAWRGREGRRDLRAVTSPRRDAGAAALTANGGGRRKRKRDGAERHVEPGRAWRGAGGCGRVPPLSCGGGGRDTAATATPRPGGTAWPLEAASTAGLPVSGLGAGLGRGGGRRRVGKDLKAHPGPTPARRLVAIHCVKAPGRGPTWAPAAIWVAVPGPLHPLSNEFPPKLNAPLFCASYCGASPMGEAASASYAGREGGGDVGQPDPRSAHLAEKSNLTVDAVKLHNELQSGSLRVERPSGSSQLPMEEGDAGEAATERSSGTFLSGLSDCTNVTFSRVQRFWESNSAAHKEVPEGAGLGVGCWGVAPILSKNLRVLRAPLAVVTDLCRAGSCDRCDSLAGGQRD